MGIQASIGGDITLNVEAFKVRGLQRARLTWSGTAAPNLDVFRDGNSIATVGNTGEYVDEINRRGGGSYLYQVCEVESEVCSEQVAATFQ